MNHYCCQLLLFRLLNSVDGLYAYYYWMWNLTPSVWMLPYVGNVQITRTSCGCELTLSCVFLGSLWYVTGWGFLFCFLLLRIVLSTMLLNLLDYELPLSCYVEAAVPKIVEQVDVFEITFRCEVKWILTGLFW